MSHLLTCRWPSFPSRIEHCSPLSCPPGFTSSFLAEFKALHSFTGQLLLLLFSGILSPNSSTLHPWREQNGLKEYNLFACGNSINSVKMVILTIIAGTIETEITAWLRLLVMTTSKDGPWEWVAWSRVGTRSSEEENPKKTKTRYRQK